MPKKMTNARKSIGSKVSWINSQYFSTDLFSESVDVQILVFGALSAMEALYENSKPFAAFLKKQGLGAILRKTKLRMRETHRIVPHVSKNASFVLQHAMIVSPSFLLSSVYRFHSARQPTPYQNFRTRMRGIAA